MDKLIVLGQWIIVSIAAIGFIYNTIVSWGTLRNEVKHLNNDIKELKETQNSIWKEINAIKAYLMEHHKEKDEK